MCIGFFSKLVLRIKSSEGMKRSVRQTNSRKKPKAKQKQKKKKQKIDRNKPKKPPTAFFYFLYSYFFSPFFLYLCWLFMIMIFYDVSVIATLCTCHFFALFTENIKFIRIWLYFSFMYISSRLLASA